MVALSPRKIDPKEQFSKRLARWTAVFWFFYLTYLTAMMVIEPAIAQAAIYLGGFVCLVMLINVWAYTHNSVYDKAFYWASRIEEMRAGKKDKDKPEDDKKDEGEGGNG